MDKTHYFDLMRETSARAYSVLSRQIDTVKDIDPELHRIMRYVVDRKRNDLLLKPFLLRLAFELCGGGDWEKTVPAGAAFELLNLSSYQANSSFDNKHAVLTVAEKNSQFIAAMVTREMSLECLGVAGMDCGDAVLAALREDLSLSNKHIYVAQHYDLNLLTVKRFECYADEEVYIREYTARCFHGSGIFTGRCARAGALLAGASPDRCDALQKFGEAFGTGLHFMNDLADFVPPGAPGGIAGGFQDQLSDMKNGRLTLGYYMLLTNPDAEGARLLHEIQGGDLSTETLTCLVSFMNSHGIISKIRRRGERYAKTAKQAIASFENSPTKAMLSTMVSACHDNAYTWFLTRGVKYNEGVADGA